MKKLNRYYFGILFAVIITLPGFSNEIYANNNLVTKNSGFEMPAKIKGQIPGWGINYWSRTPKQKIEISKERASEGTQSLKIYLEKPNYRKRFGVTIFQQLAIPDPNKEWLLSFDCWSDAEICLKLVISCAPGNKIPYEFKFYNTTKDKKWHKVNVTLPALKFTKENMFWDKKNIWLELCVYSKIATLPASLFIDNVNVRMVSKTKEKIKVSQKLVKRYYDVKEQAGKSFIQIKNRSKQQKILEIQKALNKIRILVQRASRKKAIYTEDNTKITDTVKWAEQKLTALVSRKKSSSGMLKKCEIWAVDAIRNNYLSPDAVVIDGKLTDEFQLTLAKDQFGPVCFLVHADVNINNLRFEVSPFTDSKGKTISAVQSDLRGIKWWYQDHGGSSGLERTGIKMLKPELLLHDDSLVKVNKVKKGNFVRVYKANSKYIRSDNPNGLSRVDARNLPDKDAVSLMPLDIKARTNRLFWLLINAKKNAPAGEFSSKINVYSKGGKLGTLKVKLRILPFVLDKPYYSSSIYYRSPNYTNEPGYPPCYSTEQAWKQYRMEMENLRDHGVDMVRFDRPIVQMTWKMWPYMEDILRRLKIRKSLGMRTDVVFLNYPVQNPQNPKDLKELENKVRKLISELAGHGVKEVYFYGLDEARGKRLLSQRKAWEAVHRGGGKIYTAGFSSEGMYKEFGNLLDLFICEGEFSRKISRNWHKNGKKIGSYGNPQGGLEKPELYRKNYGIRMWQYGYDVAMTYVYHNAPIQTDGSLLTAWNDFALNSDIMKQLMMVYPTAEGVIDTLQWEGYREGVNDVRYITTLERLCNEFPEKEKSNNVITEAEKFLQNLRKGDVVKDKINMDKLRKQLIRHISKIIALKSKYDKKKEL